MNDDSSGRSSSISRRRLLALASTSAAAGVAGCSILGTSSDSEGSPTGTGTDGPDKSIPDSLYEGETIPPVPHASIANDPPTVPAPAKGVTNPVLTADDVTDFGNVDYVADPYMFVEGGTWHMFFEVLNSSRNPDAAIGHATSQDGLDWTYDQTVLEKADHTSFPFVLKWEGEYYMLPPTGRHIELWKASSFPTDWERVGTLVEQDYYTKDATLARWNDRWWLFMDRDNEDLMVFHSDTLEPGGWEPHAQNPVATGRPSAARQGGRPIVMDDSLYLFFQDVEYEYGDEIRAHEVTELTTDAYSDRAIPDSPLLAGFGSGWNGGKMHHFDPWSLGEGNGWRCSVDGATDEEDRWAIGIYDVPPSLSVDPDSVPGGADNASGYYALDKETNVAVDQTGNHNHGMIRGTSETTTGDCTGLNFEEDRDRVTFPDPYESALDSGSFTMLVSGTIPTADAPQTLWAYTSLHVNRRLAARYRNDGSWLLTFSGTQGEPIEASVAASGDPGDQFQLAVTYTEGDGYKVFENGQPKTQVRDVGSPYHEVCFLTLGGTLPGQFPWKGSVHSVGVYNTALGKKTLQEIDENSC